MSEKFYLVCFVVGFAFSALSFLLGTVHLPHWVHLPHLGIDHGVPHVHTHVHLPHAHVHVHAPAGAHGPGSANTYEVSPFNFSTLMAFLTWFGGAGYLLTHYERLWGLLALLVSIASGTVGGAIVFFFMAKVLMRPDENLDPADYDMVGVLGRLAVRIREDGGTGEIVYAQGGTRKTAAARSETGEAMEKGAEVVVTRYEKGIAYVRRWEDMTGEPRPEELRADDNK